MLVKFLQVKRNGHKIKALEKRLKREQRRLSRKFKRRFTTEHVANIVKQLLRVQKLQYRLACIREEYVKSVAVNLVKTKPRYITIEDLNIRGMMQNRHLSKAIQGQCFHKFKMFLKSQCFKHNIELRIADRFYPSSKLCHECGIIKHDLKLKDRTYVCDCGNKVDRDLNASLNLRDCQTYKVAS